MSFTLAEIDALRNDLERYEALKAENDRLREALTRIAKMKGTYGFEGTYSAGAFANEIARAALAKEAGQ